MKSRPIENAPPTKKTRIWLAMGVILLVGLLLRSGYLIEFADDPTFAVPMVDAGFHDYWARGLATGDWTPPHNNDDPLIRSTPYLKPPGYPWFLAAVYKLSAGSRLAPRLAQMALGLLNCLLAFVIARRWYGSGVGLIFAAFMAVYWIFIYYEGELLEPALLIFLLLSFTYAAGRLIERFSIPRALIAGVLLGLAALVRANALLVLPFMIAWLCWIGWRRIGKRRLIATAVASILGVFIAIAPATIRNYVVAREFVLISANAGINLYIGNNQAANGRFVQTIEDLGDFQTCFDYPAIVAGLRHKLGEPLTYPQVSRYFTRQALRFIRQHPADFIRLTITKAGLFWGPDELSHNKVVHYERQHSALLRWLPGDFACVVALFIVGGGLLTIDTLRSRRAKSPTPLARPVGISALLGLMVLVYFLSYLPFFNAAIYRVPIVPFLLFFGAYGVWRIVQLVRSRSYAPAIIAAAACVVLILLLRALRTEPEALELAKWHSDRAYAYQLSGDDRPAIDEYRQSLQVKSDGPRALRVANNLAWVLATQTSPTPAQAAEAIRIAESCRRAFDHPTVLDTLAAAYARAGRFNDAVRTAETALRQAERMGEDNLAATIAEHLAHYRADRPFIRAEGAP